MHSVESDSVIERAKQRARSLHRAVQQGDAHALHKVRQVRELRALSAESLARDTQRRHCLAVVARALGLNGWSHLTELWGAPEANDFGTLLYPSSCGGHWNIWCARYDEARDIRAEHGGFLLPYRHQLVIVEGDFIRDMGLDPGDSDWARIGRDWARPADPHARHRLCRAALAARMQQTQ